MPRTASSALASQEIRRAEAALAQQSQQVAQLKQLNAALAAGAYYGGAAPLQRWQR